MSNVIYVFLDIDGVLNNLNYLKECYSRHGKSMSFYHMPFDPKSLLQLMYLVQELQDNSNEVKVVLSSTWRLGDIDKEVVNSRLAEYGLRIDDVTPWLSSDRGLEIKEYLKNKEYKDIIILDDDSFDIINYYPDRLINTKYESGFTEKDRYKALDILLGTDRKKWKPKFYNPN